MYKFAALFWCCVTCKDNFFFPAPLKLTPKPISQGASGHLINILGQSKLIGLMNRGFLASNDKASLKFFTIGEGGRSSP